MIDNLLNIVANILTELHAQVLTFQYQRWLKKKPKLEIGKVYGGRIYLGKLNTNQMEKVNDVGEKHES